MQQNGYVRGFAGDKCTQCGACLAGCHYQKFTPEQARDIMKKLTAEAAWRPEISSCLRCGKCDHRCPRQARPGSLMRECQELRRRGRPLPPAAAYAINGMRPEGWGASFFTDVYLGLAAPDRRILSDWAAPKQGRDLLFIGCTDRMMPRNVEQSAALRNIPKFGGPDDCCGVWAMQAGRTDEGLRIAGRLVDRLRQSRFDRLVVGCGHCQKVLTRILPESLGPLPFPVISVYDYLLEQVETGAARVRRPVQVDAAVSDPCFGYENGADYQNSIRRLAAAIGMNLAELPHNRADSLCCGYGALFNNGKLRDAARAIRIKRRDLAAAGRRHVLSYCPGCHLVNHYFQPGYRSHYLLEDALFALGDRVPAPASIFYRRLLRPRSAWRLLTLAPKGL